ncbi:MAG: hypothetical protein AB1405_02525 [Bdellovibrionota bacterium]
MNPAGTDSTIVTPKPEKKSSRRGGGGRPPSRPGKDRKDRVVQTRVPGDLEDVLKEAARTQRVTVSHLIRNVLEDTFNLVDNLVAQGERIAETVSRDAKRIAESAKGLPRSTPPVPPLGQPPAPPAVPPVSGSALSALESVYAWQELILARDTACTKCGTSIPKNSKALKGVTDVPTASPIWVCESCHQKM